MELIRFAVNCARSQPVLAVVGVAFSVLLLVSIRSYWRLSHIPGPLLANFTNIPRFLWVLSYKAHEKHIEQHRKYGPIVRFGPNMVSVGDPAEIGTIYRFSKPWQKVRGCTIYRAARPRMAH